MNELRKLNDDRQADFSPFDPSMMLIQLRQVQRADPNKRWMTMMEPALASRWAAGFAVDQQE